MIGWNILLWARVDSITLTGKLAPSQALGLRSTAILYFLGTCYPVYQWRREFSVPLLTLLQLQSYLVPCISARIFIIPKLQNIRCKQFLCELFSLCIDIFLIVILLDLLAPISSCHRFSDGTGALVNTLLVHFQLKRFLIYSDQFVQNALYLRNLQNRCLILWRLLLSGFRWVVSDRKNPLGLKIRFVSRDLVPSDRATCTIASRVNSFDTKSSPSTIDLEVWGLSVSPAIICCNQCNLNNIPKHFYIKTSFSDSCLQRSQFIIYHCDF